METPSKIEVHHTTRLLPSLYDLMRDRGDKQGGLEELRSVFRLGWMGSAEVLLIRYFRAALSSRVIFYDATMQIHL